MPTPPPAGELKKPDQRREREPGSKLERPAGLEAALESIRSGKTPLVEGLEKMAKAYLEANGGEVGAEVPPEQRAELVESLQTVEAALERLNALLEAAGDTDMQAQVHAAVTELSRDAKGEGHWAKGEPVAVVDGEYKVTNKPVTLKDIEAGMASADNELVRQYDDSGSDTTALKDALSTGTVNERVARGTLNEGEEDYVSTGDEGDYDGAAETAEVAEEAGAAVEDDVKDPNAERNAASDAILAKLKEPNVSGTVNQKLFEKARTLIEQHHKAGLAVRYDVKGNLVLGISEPDGNGLRRRLMTIRDESNHATLEWIHTTLKTETLHLKEPRYTIAEMEDEADNEDM